MLYDYILLFVHVTSPLVELQRREQHRGDRAIALAEEQLAIFCPLDKTYDLTVDTHINTIEECADKIIVLLDYPEKFTAFKTLWSQRAE